MSSLLFLVPPLVFLGVGAALLGCVPSVRFRSRATGLAVSYLVGVVALAGFCYVASHAAAVPIRRRTIALIVIASLFLAIAAWRRGKWRWRTTSSPAEAPARWLPRLALLPLAVVFARLLVNASTDPVTDWDGRMIWGAHAKYIQAADTVDADVFRDGKWIVVHPQYPALLPTMQVVVWRLLGTTDERAVRPAYAVFYAVILAVLFDSTRRTAGRAVAYGLTLLAGLLPVLSSADGGAGGCCSDLPLACFVGTGLFVLIEARSISGGVVAGALLAGAVLTKNEGMPLAALALIAGCLGASRLRREPRRFLATPSLVAAAVVAAAFAFLGHWQHGIPNRLDEDYGHALSVSALIQGTRSRIPRVFAAMFHEMARGEAWGHVWILFAVILLAGAPFLRSKRTTALVVFAAGSVGVYFAAYAVGGWEIVNLVQTTWNRLMIQIALPVFALVGACAGRLLKRRRSPRVHERPDWLGVTGVAIVSACGVGIALWLKG